MEVMVNLGLFNNIYSSKKVLLTGHTGFKGSWLALWLHELGAEVLGFSIDVPSIPSHFELLKTDVKSIVGDVRNFQQLEQVCNDFKPEIIFHLAAQPLVRYSYQHPLRTFDTNVMGTANVFEAARGCKSVRAIVNVTSDKCYENLEKDIAYKETDRMGGYDPYSASKGCAELIVNSYRSSFFNITQYKTSHNILLASARAGNVIGGGDWALDRLIPDIVRAVANNEPVIIRNPYATRPWQHVLEPLSGYLLLGQLLLEENVQYADGWNFGPEIHERLNVENVLLNMKNVWSNLEYYITKNTDQPHEAFLLMLDCTKANELLKWFPVWDMYTAISKTASWYKHYYQHDTVQTKDDLDIYIQNAKKKGLCWTI